ncbi:hypothetical protein QE447_001525 [Stenotrophomonas sp. SORGH_AS282]|nr:hypothetical protein [Stenotrophomonas sp. SORGH_AS_0282]
MPGGQRRFKRGVIAGVFEPVEVDRGCGGGRLHPKRGGQQQYRGKQQAHQGVPEGVRESSNGPADAPLLSRSVQIGPSAQQ